MMKKITVVLCLFLCFSNGYGQISWNIPSTIFTLSSLGVNASDPKIGMDSNSNAVAVWVENGFIKSNNMTAAGVWGTTANVLSNSGATSPRLVVDPAGNATAIWLESGVVKASTQPFGGSWGAETTLSSSGSTNPELAVDPSGNVVAVWTNGTIQSATLLFGGSWPGTPNTISAANADHASVAISANGTVIASWQVLASSVNSVFYSEKTISGSWTGTGTRISTAAINSVYPKVAIDPNGNAIAIWYVYALSGSNYYSVLLEGSYQPSGGSFTLPIIISTEPGVVNPANLYAKCAFDQYGTAIFMWSNSLDGSTYTITSEGYGLEQGLSGVTRLIAQNLYSSTFDFVCNSYGDVVAVYESADSSTPPNISIGSQDTDIESYNSRNGFFWIADGTISSGNANGFPRIAAGVTSGVFNLTSVWINYNGSNTIIQTVNGSETLLAAPTNPQITQSSNTLYGFFTDIVNTVTWTAPSPSTGVLGYAIYRNGLLIGTVGTSTTQWVDHNQISGGPVTYNIASIGANAYFSPYATVTLP